MMCIMSWLVLLAGVPAVLGGRFGIGLACLFVGGIAAGVAIGMPVKK